MCKGSNTRLTIVALVAALLASSFSSETRAALLPAPSDPAADKAKATAELAIPPREIPARADADERYARDVEAHAQQTRMYDTQRADLDALAANVSQVAMRWHAEDLSSLPALKITALERRWHFYERQLDSWRREQQRLVDEYADEATQVESRRESWNATLAPENQLGSALALKTRVDEVLAALTAADRALSRPMSLQLGLGRRASAVQSTIDAELKAVDVAVANYDRRLWQIDEPPLWELWQSEAASASPVSAASAGLGVDRSFLREYLKTNRDHWWAHIGAAVLLLPILVWLRRQGRRWFSAHPELAASGESLMRPVSSWLVIVLLGVLVFERDGPLVLREAALLLAMVPVLRLLPKRLFEVLGPWPYAAAALYVLYRLGFAFVGDTFWHRIHLLTVTLLTLGVLLWMLMRTRERPSAGQLARANRAARNLGWIAIGLLALSTILNLFGNVSLAEVLAGATLDSGYIGLALLAGAGVLSAIVQLLVARHNESTFKVVTARAGPLLQASGHIINVAALVLWIIATLNAFRIWRPVTHTARVVLTYPFGVGNISLTLGSVLLFFGAIYVAFWVARSMRMILSDELLPRMSLPRGVANSVATLTYYALVLLGLLVALAASGFEVGQFAIVFGALGVGIGFGLQNVVNNFVSGLILMFERPIQPGDVVEITGTAGTVREIGMRATTLTTFEGADVVVPNGTLLSEKLVNWTLSDMNRRIDVNVGVAYGSDPRRVIALLTEITTAVPGIAPFPAPSVIFAGFGASSLDFGIRAWTNDFSGWVAIRTELSLRVYDALRSEGIEIPFPQHDVHMRTVASEARHEAQPQTPQPQAAQPHEIKPEAKSPPATEAVSSYGDLPQVTIESPGDDGPEEP